MPPTAQLICPACRADTEPGERFCARCGRDLAAPSAGRPAARPAPTAQHPEPDDRITCPHCGAPNPDEARGCLLCGRSLRQPAHALLRPLREGRVLGGRYTVRRPLSRGGMGALYLAADAQGGAEVVVKALGDYFDPADERQAQAARARLAKEAQTLASLSHPAVPRTLGSFQDGPQVFLVMEHIDGADLSQGLLRGDGGAYPAEDVLRWGVALCRVLEHLAARPEPVVHHDVKPANVIVAGGGRRVYLVDFGTAQVRLDPGGGAALDQPSLYGTVGYAPPEQYRGQSEPRSDVYALAATLYHLATGDDPAEHPFSFPQLAGLGALGDALRGALDQDVRRRPSAGELRVLLEGLLAATGATLLSAPDGTPLADRAALAAWCLGSWQRAAEWLYAGLPDQLELWWGKAGLAAALRRVVRAEQDRDVALDSALALLDPAGVGQERPRLSADTAEVDLGTLPGSLLRRDITVVNSGRRFVRMYVFLPRWLKGSSGALRLAPGERTVLSVAPDVDRLYLGGRLRGELLVRDHYGRAGRDVPLLRIRLRAFAQRRYILARRYRLPLGGAGLALLLWAGAGFPLPQGQGAPLDARIGAPQLVAAPAASGAGMLAEARAALESGDAPAARALLARYAAANGQTPESAALLADTLYRIGVEALGRRAWRDAQEGFAGALALQPGYRDAEELLLETHLRAAEAARARGDLAGARRELSALLARSPNHQAARALLEQIQRP